VARFSPYTLQMQITRMFIEGQAFFATTKVQDWLQQRGEDPQTYEILFHKKPAPPGSQDVFAIDIELRRRDGQPVDPWLLDQLQQQR